MAYHCIDQIQPTSDALLITADGLDCYCAAVAYAAAAYGQDFPQWFLALTYFHAHYDVPAEELPGVRPGTSIELIYWSLAKYFGLAPDIAPTSSGGLERTVCSALERGAPVLVPIHTSAYQPSPDFHDQEKAGPHLLLVKGYDEAARSLTVFDCEHNMSLLWSRLVESASPPNGSVDASFRLASSARRSIPLAVFVGDVWSDLNVPLQVVLAAHSRYNERCPRAPLAGACAALVRRARREAAPIASLADVLRVLSRTVLSTDLETLVAPKREAITRGAELDLPSALLYANSQRVIAKTLARQLRAAGVEDLAGTVEEAGKAAAAQWRSLVLPKAPSWESILATEQQFLDAIVTSGDALGAA